MHEGERPLGAELWKAEKKSEEVQRISSQEGMHESVPLPDDIRESIVMHRETIEHEMREDFGIPEVPKQILS